MTQESLNPKKWCDGCQQQVRRAIKKIGEGWYCKKHWPKEE